VKVNGSGFGPGTPVRVAFGAGRQPADKELTADNHGGVSAVVGVPTSAAVGWDSIVLSGVTSRGQSLVEDVALDVVRG
jgi:hypothetical protein